jgi:hypothetical protein
MVFPGRSQLFVLRVQSDRRNRGGCRPEARLFGATRMGAHGALIPAFADRPYRGGADRLRRSQPPGARNRGHCHYRRGGGAAPGGRRDAVAHNVADLGHVLRYRGFRVAGEREPGASGARRPLEWSRSSGEWSRRSGKATARDHTRVSRPIDRSSASATHPQASPPAQAAVPAQTVAARATGKIKGLQGLGRSRDGRIRLPVHRFFLLPKTLRQRLTH